MQNMAEYVDIVIDIPSAKRFQKPNAIHFTKPNPSAPNMHANPTSLTSP